MFDFIGKICLVAVIFAAGHYIGVDGIVDFVNRVTGQ
jgi:hypothetical protein